MVWLLWFDQELSATLMLDVTISLVSASEVRNYVWEINANIDLQKINRVSRRGGEEP